MNGNVIVMSEAGKPIFSRYGSPGEVARQCGLIQALRTAVNVNNSTLGLGEIQSIHSENLCIVFMTVGSITLINTLEKDKTNPGDDAVYAIDTEAFGRLQLEYVYANLIFILTSNIQNAFLHNPGFDLRSMMNSNDNLLRGLLDESDPEGNPGPFLVSSVQSFFPISYRVRHETSKTLQSMAGKMENNIAFAMLIVGNRLLTVVQPSYRPHQLRVSDLHLVINFIGKQPGLMSGEQWIPMCLPRFNSRGFLYAYTNCFDTESKLTLVLLSSHSTTEQFQILRTAAQKIRERLHVPLASDSVLTIVKDEKVLSSSSTNSATSDVLWKRTSDSFDNSSTNEDGFVNISAEMLGKEGGIPEEEDLLHQVKHAIEISSTDFIRTRYLKDEGSHSVLHFLVRYDISVENCLRKKRYNKQQPGYLSQCVSLPLVAPFACRSSRRRLWSNYQKLSLRLRLGSASVESSIDAFDMIKNDSGLNDKEKSGLGFFDGIGRYCPAIGLNESTPYNSDGLSYVIEGDETFLAMNGKFFELYMVTPKSIPMKKAATMGAKIVREITLDEKILFLSRPLTWED